MSGMITRVRPPRRDERNAHGALPLREPGTRNRTVTRETPTHEYAAIATRSRAD